jgi:hypothetical protein
MKPIPTGPLRRNLGTWAVAVGQLPMVTAAMLEALPRETFDPGFRGQHLHTAYFDTPRYDLRKARLKKDRYLTLRIRCYRQDGEDQMQYALSAKTENGKIRFPLDAKDAEAILAGQYPAWPQVLLPGDLQARLLELTGGDPLFAVVCIQARRYAVEDAEGEGMRLTLDTGVCTDTGKQLPFGVLEFKSSADGDPVPASIVDLNLRPIKSSKFLWATNTEG